MWVLRILVRLHWRCAGPKRSSWKRVMAAILDPVVCLGIRSITRVILSIGIFVPGRVEALAKDLVTDVHDPKERVKRLCGYVYGEIEYMSMDRWLHPEHVLYLGVGDCKNQAVLLEKMLEEVGLASRIVVGIIKKETNNPVLHAWIDISGPEENIILDSTLSCEPLTDKEYRRLVQGYIDVTPEYNRKRQFMTA